MKKNLSGETSFRQAHEGDVETLLAFMEQLYRHDRIPWNEPQARAALANLLTHPDLGQVWLIEHEGETAGYLVLTLGYSLEYHGRDAFIDEIFIREEYRGQGIGKAALEFAEEACRALGVKALHLEVERTNLSAQAFYRSAGFEDHDRYLMTRRIALPENNKKKKR